MLVDIARLKKLAPGGRADIMLPVANALNAHLSSYQIDTPLRIAHFLAQAAQECDGFRTLTEYASGEAYEGRKDLGNLKTGDGRRYKGRGIFQLTGRANYRAYGKKIGLDLEAKPELAAAPDVSVLVACEYWKAKDLNAWADRDDLREITRRINGGYNGLSHRQTYLNRAKQLFPGYQSPPAKAPLPVEEIPDAPIAPEPNKPWYKQTETVVAGGGILSSLAAFSQSPWGFATIALLLCAGAFGYWLYKRHQREKIEKPT